MYAIMFRTLIVAPIVSAVVSAAWTASFLQDDTK